MNLAGPGDVSWLGSIRTLWDFTRSGLPRHVISPDTRTRAPKIHTREYLDRPPLGYRWGTVKSILFDNRVKYAPGRRIRLAEGAVEALSTRAWRTEVGGMAQERVLCT
jgi:hypothetical protein